MKNLSILMQKEAVLAVESGDAWTADTIEDLARLMKLPAANLQATIDDYNTGMKTGLAVTFRSIIRPTGPALQA